VNDLSANAAPPVFGLHSGARTAGFRDAIEADQVAVGVGQTDAAVRDQRLTVERVRSGPRPYVAAVRRTHGVEVSVAVPRYTTPSRATGEPRPRAELARPAGRRPRATGRRRFSREGAAAVQFQGQPAQREIPVSKSPGAPSPCREAEW